MTPAELDARLEALFEASPPAGVTASQQLSASFDQSGIPMMLRVNCMALLLAGGAAGMREVAATDPGNVHKILMLETLPGSIELLRLAADAFEEALKAGQQ